MASKRKNTVLMAGAQMGIKMKGTSGARVSSILRISPLSKFKDTVPPSAGSKQGQKRASAKNHKTMTLGKSKAGDQIPMSDFVMRTTTSLSPNPSAQEKPRKIKMPSVFSPECLMMARSSKSILSRVKGNLCKLCETD